MIKDPTHNNLPAALLDQHVAGTFGRKPYAYVAVLKATGKQWGIGIAVEDEHGYHPITDETDANPLFEYDTYQEADDFCIGMNAHIGLTRVQSLTIVVSTMRKSNRLRMTSQ